MFNNILEENANVYQYFGKIQVFTNILEKFKCLPIFWKKMQIFTNILKGIPIKILKRYTNILKENEYLEGEEIWSPLHLRFAEGCLDSLEICDEH